MAGKRKLPTVAKPPKAKTTRPKRQRKPAAASVVEEIIIEDEDHLCEWIGEPIQIEEAKRLWPHRYADNPDSKITRVKCHYREALVEEEVYSLNDDAMTKGEEGEGKLNFICKIIEFFESVHGVKYFTAQWYYRASETVIQKRGNLISDRRIFLSEVKDDNLFNTLVEKAVVTSLPFEATAEERPLNHFYCDMRYLVPYSSFVNFNSGSSTKSSGSFSITSSDVDAAARSHKVETITSEKTMLDLYAGCGAMSTGLCLGANSQGVKLITKWAVDFNKHACRSLKLNHPETQVRHMTADNFLKLLKEWHRLCTSPLMSGTVAHESVADEVKAEENDDNNGCEKQYNPDEYEVEEILDIRCGDPKDKENSELQFKIRWKGYSPEADTWEPEDCLSSCQDKLKEFLSSGLKAKILPLPGTVDVICGGPPCQGISGFNRFRNKSNPLEGDKNKQLLVFLEIVYFLKAKYVLMENVVDLLKFAEGYLGRYALGSLVSKGYQARLGIMAAGTYGLPQYRMRVFLWGALTTESLPQYPLPTHEAKKRGVCPLEFQSNIVAHEEDSKVQLQKALYLEDAISDFPRVNNDEERDAIPYASEPKTEFQCFIRLRKDEMPGSLEFNGKVRKHMLYDHFPLRLNDDDYERVCQIPKKKGANFRNLAGVIVDSDNKVKFDPNVERKMVTSGKPLVPDYAMSFVNGTSSKPFGRMWWDETVATVVGRAEPHNQKILHPDQDRVLTVRENARLQGFPDFYKLKGPTKARYVQVGNAVAVPVARALGVSLARAFRGDVSPDQPVFTLPEGYPY